MKYSRTPAPGPLLTYQQLAQQLRLDDNTDRDYVLDLADACYEYAEEAMNCTLLERTITATFYCGDKLLLPRGPVISLVSATDLRGAISAGLEGYGNGDWLSLANGFQPPLTVVYTAGYGSAVTDVPSDIRLAIRTHVCTMYQYRASTTEKTLMATQHGLEAFYLRKNRQCGVG